MTPDAGMERHIRRAAELLRPSLHTDLAPAGEMDVERLRRCTGTVQDVLRAARTACAAVYVAWDVAGCCQYVGSVRRPRSVHAVRDRLREHLADEERRASWYALTALPLRAELRPEDVRGCEEAVAFALRPVAGRRHPRVGGLDLPAVTGSIPRR